MPFQSFQYTQAGTFTEDTSIITVSDYGAKGDGITYDTAAIQAAMLVCKPQGGTVLFPKGTYRIGSNITLDENVRFVNEAKLSVDSGITVTISGVIDAGMYHIFSGAGNTYLNAGSCERVLPQWWGAVGDDSTDCTAAFNAALSAADKVGTLYVPAGTYQISTSLVNWPQSAATSYLRTGIVFRGAGNADTIIKYTGTTGYALDVRPRTLLYSGVSDCHLIEDLHIMCPNITDIDSGGAIAIRGAYNSVNNVVVTYCKTGTAFVIMGRDVSVDATGNTHDTNRDLTTTGAGASEKYAIKFTTQSLAYRVHSATVTMGRVGSPAGTISFEIWSDDGGSPSEPNAQIAEDSLTIDCDSLSTDAGGAAVKLTFGQENSIPTTSASTVYWLVITTTGYTYTDGVTEVWVRVDAGDGDSDGFATYDTGGPGWSTSDDGANFVAEITFGQPIHNTFNDCKTFGPTGQVGRAFRIEDGSIVGITGSYLNCVKGIYGDAMTLTMNDAYLIASGKTFEIYGNGKVLINTSWLEGSATPSSIRGTVAFNIFNSRIGGGYWNWTEGVMFRTIGCHEEPQVETYDNSIQSSYWKYRVLTAAGARWGTGGGVTGTTVDADALQGECIQLDAQNEYVRFAIFPSEDTSQYFYGQLPAGTYRCTVWAKDTDQVWGDLRMYVQVYQSGSWSEDYMVRAGTGATLTSDYRPYEVFITVAETQFASSLHGNRIQFHKAYATANTISISHIVIEYMGPDDLHRNEFIAYNTEKTDADGGRESRVIFYGRQSGGESTALAAITASHDGSGDDQYGKLAIGVNDGDDHHVPTTLLTLDSDGDIEVSGRIHHNSVVSFAAGDTTPSVANGNVFKTANTGATTITMFDDGVAGQKITVIIGDGNTTLDFTGTNLKGNGGADWPSTTNDHMTCIYDGTNWYCDVSDNT